MVTRKSAKLLCRGSIPLHASAVLTFFSKVGNYTPEVEFPSMEKEQTISFILKYGWHAHVLKTGLTPEIDGKRYLKPRNEPFIAKRIPNPFNPEKDPKKDPSWIIIDDPETLKGLGTKNPVGASEKYLVKEKVIQLL